MKRIYIFVAIAALFAACSSDDLSVAEKQTPVTANDGSVGFDAYLQRSVTRAGATRDMTLTQLQDPKVGFGVFGYYTDNRDYDQLAQPNFFYNQQIKFDGVDKWTYEPVKYWPNEYGNKAISDDQDRVTFFAYAPYVNVDPNTGKFIEDQTAIAAARSVVTTEEGELEAAKTAFNTAKLTYVDSGEKAKYDAWEKRADELGTSMDTEPSSDEDKALYNAYKNVTDINDHKSAYDAATTALTLAQTEYDNAVAAVEALKGDVGITGMTRNTASGDPMVKYIGSFEAMKAVDLCWGVCPQDKWAIVNTGEAQTMTVGKPWINVERPSQTTQPVKFQFRHALAKMQVDIDAFVDGTDNTKSLDGNTRIWVRQVKFNGFTMKGALNLNNDITNEPYWMNYNGVGDLESDGEVVIYDGRKDGKEAVNGAIATNEKSLGLNKQIVETDLAFSGVNTWNGTFSGVNEVKKTLFEGGGIFYVIPTGDEMEVEIIYDVETINQNIGFTLADNQSLGTAIENRISKKISFGGTNNKLESGKAYQINLHLGMNSVEFDAEVVGWEDMTKPDVDLPANLPFYTVGDVGKTGKAIIPYNFKEFEFGINGFNGGEVVTTTTGNNSWNSATGVATGTPTNPTLITGWSVENPMPNANASGYRVYKLTTTENKTTSNRTQVITWKGASSNKQVEMTFTQQAAPLALKAPATTTAGNNYTLQRDIDSAPNYGFFCKGLSEDCAVLTANGDPTAAVPTNGIRVWRNGTLLKWVTTWSTSPVDPTEYKFTDNGQLSLNEAAQVGDVIKVTLKTGDAPAETISWTVAPTP